MRATAACSASNRTADGIASGLGLDDFGAGALSPDFELIDGGGTKSVGGAEQDVFSLRAEDLREFADRRGLARAVDADDQNHFRRAIDFADGARIRCVQNRQQFFFQQALEFLHVFDLLAVGLVAQFAENFLRGGIAQVGADERGFEIVERVAVDFFAEGDDFLDALGEVLASARDRLLHAVEEAGLSFLLRGCRTEFES